MPSALARDLSVCGAVSVDLLISGQKLEIMTAQSSALDGHPHHFPRLREHCRREARKNEKLVRRAKSKKLSSGHNIADTVMHPLQLRPPAQDPDHRHSSVEGKGSFTPSGVIGCLKSVSHKTKT